MAAAFRFASPTTAPAPCSTWATRPSSCLMGRLPRLGPPAPRRSSAVPAPRPASGDRAATWACVSDFAWAATRIECCMVGLGRCHLQRRFGGLRSALQCRETGLQLVQLSGQRLRIGGRCCVLRRCRWGRLLQLGDTRAQLLDLAAQVRHLRLHRPQRLLFRLRLRIDLAGQGSDLGCQTLRVAARLALRIGPHPVQPARQPGEQDERQQHGRAATPGGRPHRLMVDQGCTRSLGNFGIGIGHSRVNTPSKVGVRATRTQRHGRGFSASAAAFPIATAITPRSAGSTPAGTKRANARAVSADRNMAAC